METSSKRLKTARSEREVADPSNERRTNGGQSTQVRPQKERTWVRT
jgi:hypothetical protein